MKKFIFFNILQIFFKAETSDMYKLNMYQNNNFNVFVPCKAINELPLYLPENINSVDLNKIKDFVSKTPQIDYKTSDNEYKLEFYVDVEGVHLKNITIQEFQSNKEIIPLSLSRASGKNTPVISSSSKTSSLNIKTTIINETIRLLTINNLVNENSLIAYGLPLHLVKSIVNITDKIKIYHYQNQMKFKNIEYNFILEKKPHRRVEIVGIKVVSDKYEEVLYVINSPLGGAQLLINKDGEIIPEAISGLNRGAPVAKTYQKLGSPFGFRRDPKNHRLRKHHGGQDIVVSLNTPLISVEDGLIVDCGYNKGYGFFIVIHHGTATKNGYSSVYGHLNAIHVTMGQKIKKGQIIGLSGSTGRSTGPHLHFEWIKNQNSQRLNPLISTTKKTFAYKKLLQPLMKEIIELVDNVGRII